MTPNSVYLSSWIGHNLGKHETDIARQALFWTTVEVGRTTKEAVIAQNQNLFDHFIKLNFFPVNQINQHRTIHSRSIETNYFNQK